MARERRPIRVLHVDDDPSFAELTATFLERENDRLTVENAASVDEALEHLDGTDFDCIVSDYDMPDRNGIDLLETVREDDPKLPFVLFTGKGSEEIASDAIQAGVTDYLQKDSGTSKYAVLANRIDNAVSQYHAERTLEETTRRYQRLIEESTDVIMVVDPSGEFEYVSPATERLLGYPSTELLGENGFEYIHPADRDIAMERFAALVEDASARISTEFRFDHPDDGWMWLEAKGRNLLDDPTIDGLVVSVHDITDRRERATALRRERDRASALFEDLGEPAVEVAFEAEEAVVQRVNEAFEDVFGFDEQTVVGDSLDEHIVPPGERESASELNRLLEEGERVERELKRETTSGTRSFLHRSVPIPTNEGSRAYGLYLDVTARKRQEERFQAFIEHSMDLIAVLNPDGTLQYRSPSGERILGYGPGALLGEEIFEYVHPDDRDAVIAEFEAATENPEASAITEFRFRHVDGSWIWLEAIGNNQLQNPAIEGVVVNARDVTERKAYEQRLGTLHEATRELMAAESKQAIADIASDTATTILDFPVNGVHLYDESENALVPVATSSANREIIGASPTFHPGEGMAWEVFETGEAQLHGDVGAATEKYNPDTPVKSEILLPLGDHGVFIISSTTVDDFDDVDSGLAQVLAANLEAALDRAERRAELETQKEELRRQNERLDEFASAVSHDLRNPLNVAQAALDTAELGDDESFEQIAWAHQRMERLIEDLLSLAREGKHVHKTSPVALDAVVERSWRTVKTDEANLRVETDGRILADDGRLQQLLENLFRNALEHGGASVTVTAGSLVDEPGFYVADDGTGIPTDERERVFDSGFSTTTDGTGFGLAIIREIAHAHDWEVSATESDDGGARFEVTGVEYVDG